MQGLQNSEAKRKNLCDLQKEPSSQTKTRVIFTFLAYGKNCRS